MGLVMIFSANLYFTRRIMTKVVASDILNEEFDMSTEVLHPAGTKVMLAFLNIASCPSIIALGSTRTSVLSQALTFLSSNLDDRGTIALALPDMFCDSSHLLGSWPIKDSGSLTH